MGAGGRLSIGEVARSAGVRASTIRYYESVGLLGAPARERGRRYYEEGILELLRIVQLAQRAGFSLTEIRRLLHGFGTASAAIRWRTLAARKLDEIAALIDRAQRKQRLIESLMMCECGALTDCVKPNLVPLTRARAARAAVGA